MKLARHGYTDTNLWICVLQYHMASHPVYGGGVSLANDPQNEHSVVGNHPDFLMLHHWGSPQQKAEFIPARLAGKMETKGYKIDGDKKWQTGAHSATHFLVFERISGKFGSPRGITVKSFECTLNMPTDHATILFDDIRVPASAVLGPLDNGLTIVQTFMHENRIRQAASSCGAAKFCIDRVVFGKTLSVNQAI
ncbi:hypothetical protein E0Z10_g9129 [Xylaria hypoxylon]|uniref:Uncharacterized protein n=1 Tax=Xylaria hypoxylon TaxID=37992 RepID=A0A4Z0YL92_9PEZI|nr:hypothetical protein E0Z10_g9129 [Xylaria hypoxylon]